MNRHFDLRYRLTLDDYEVLSRRYARLTRTRRIVLVLHAIADTALFLAAAYFWWAGQWGLAIYFLALVAFLLVLVFVVGPWQRRRQFAHQRLGEHDVDLHADEEGFSTKSTLAEGTYKWPAIRQIDDLAGHVLLWPNNRMGWIVPKRAFASPEMAAKFVALAKEKTDGQTL